MRRALAALAIASLLASPALAERKVQLLQAEGRADAKTRARVDGAIAKLARSGSGAGGDSIVPGEITYTDAAAAVGCKPEAASCRDEVIAMLGVDEIVVTTVTPKPGGVEIQVRRVARNGATREALAVVASDQLDQLAPLAPLFGATAAVPPPPAATSNEPIYGPPEPPAKAPPPTAPPRLTGEPAMGPAPTATALRDEPPSNRRLQLAGMAGGGTLFLVGLILWGSAAGVQSEIDDAPANTAAQVAELRRLEDKGDGYAAAGNLLVVGGLVLGGISTYYFMKRGRAQPTTARIAPAAYPGGGGLTLVFGGGTP